VIGRHLGVWHQLGRTASQQTIAGNNGSVYVNCLHSGSWLDPQQLHSAFKSPVFRLSYPVIV